MTATWFVLALLPCLLHSISNLVDQYVVRHQLGGSVLSFLALSGIICLPVAGLIYPFIHGAADLQPGTGLWVMGCAVLFSGCAIPYVIAIRDEDAHNFTVVWQTAPIIILLLCYLFFGETVSTTQMTGGGITIVASAAAMIDFRHSRFKLRPFVLIFLSSILYAIFVVALRAVAPEIDWLVITFWMCLGWFFLGIAIMTVFPKTRNIVMMRVRMSRGRIFLFASAQEIADIGANAARTAALAFALVPAALTDLLGGFQPFFALLFGYIAACLIPKYYRFENSGHDVLFQLGCFAVMLFGLWLTITD